MAIKNRPTLIQQFTDFINRISPFDGNPLIQKTEHLQVENDLFDSILLKELESASINSPSALIDIDFDTADLFLIDSSASIDSAFTITVTNLQEGFLGRVSFTKKSNDTIAFSNADISGVSNIDQFGTRIDYLLSIVNGVITAIPSQSIQKSDSVTESNSNQLATSAAAKILNDLISGLTSTVSSGLASKLSTSVFNLVDTGVFNSALIKDIELGGWNMDLNDTHGVSHGVTNGQSKVRVLSVMIINDQGNETQELMNNVNSFEFTEGSVIGVTSSSITFKRRDTGWFDNTNYNSTIINRGWVTILIDNSV